MIYKYILLDGLTYNTRGYFASCEQWAKCPRILYVKPSNKRFIIPLQKGVILCGKSVILSAKSVFQKMHHLSFRALANDVNSTESQPN